MIIIDDFTENIPHESEQKYVHNFLIQSGFTQHIEVPTTDYGSLLDYIYTRYVKVVKEMYKMAITVMMIKYFVQSKLFLKPISHH